MKTVIVEDEYYAAQRLEKLLTQLDADIEVVTVLHSVSQAVEWFCSDAEYDLVFMDIQLADGISLEIFSQAEIAAPVVFTTAYDEYALKAFEVNSIDYLLKPISVDKLSRSLRKLKQLQQTTLDEQARQIAQLQAAIAQPPADYKSRFLVKTGSRYIPIAIKDVAYFIIHKQLPWLVTTTGKRYMIDQTLDEIEAVIDPAQFYRINRQMLLGFAAISAIHPYFSNRLLIETSPPADEDVIVSKRKTPAFKGWLQK